MEPRLVRSRLMASAALAVALGMAWGPFCGYANLLRSDPQPAALFGAWRYLLITAGVCVATAVGAVVVSSPAMAVTAFCWRRLGERARPPFVGLFGLFLALLALRSLHLLPVSTNIARNPKAAVIASVMIGGLVWAIAGIFFNDRRFQLGVFPLIVLYPLLYFLEVQSIYVLFGVSAVLLGSLWRYGGEGGASTLMVEAIGALAFTVVPFAVLVHGAGHFIYPLDAPHVLGFIGLFGLVVSLMLTARCIADRCRPIGSAIAGVVCAGVLAAGVMWAGEPAEPPDSAVSPTDRPNIAFIVWDTVRAKQLQAYGYGSDTTPTFDRLASEGVLFERAVAPSGWTFPSHASMFTGMWPRTHAASCGGYRKLAAKRTTITDLLSEAGYETVGLTGNHSWAGRRAGFSQGFDLFYEPRMSAEWRTRPALVMWWLFHRHDAGAIGVRRGLRRWLFTRGKDAEKPFFLFINLFEAHHEYEPRSDLVETSQGISLRQARDWGATSINRLFVKGPPAGVDDQEFWRAMQDLYDGEIRYVDRSTADILRLLSPSEQQNTLTIVVGDHGENIGDHDLADHVFSLHETLLHVPLVMRWPGHIPGGARAEGRVSIMDLFATMADAADLPRAAYRDVPSSSLLGMWQDLSARSSDKVITAEMWPFVDKIYDFIKGHKYSLPQGRFAAPLMAIYDGHWKYIRGAGQNCEQLFNLSEDPDEQRDLSGAEPARCERMRTLLDRWLEQTPNNMPNFTDGYEVKPIRE